MIRVIPAPPPSNFDTRVRQRGLDAIAELAGDKPSRPRRGPKRKQVASRREDIPPEAFPPFWREVLPEMLESYHRLCAYLALYIEQATGSPTVDHVIPKSKAWDRVYEWSNYRLACALVNSRKGDVDAVLDPFEVEDDWFELEFVDCQVKPRTGLSVEIAEKVQDTIDKLGLSEPECCAARREYVEAYLGQQPIPFSYVERRAPFVARELRRQKMLREGES